MAAGILALQRGEPSRRGRPSSDVPPDGAMQGLGWLSIALGGAAIVAGLGGRQRGTAALALTALAA
jgi:hypothetical protein